MIFLDEKHAVEEYCKIVPATINVKTIAHNLSMQCRFNGACANFYSVAEHSVILAILFKEESIALQRLALFHDAHEAYTGDIVRPVKQRIGELEIAHLQNDLDKVIFAKMGITATTFNKKVVKERDDFLLQVECYYLFTAFQSTDILNYPMISYAIEKTGTLMADLNPRDAERRFLETYDKLFDKSL